MKRSTVGWLGVALIIATGIGASLLALRRHGFSARDRPWAAEAFVARRLRRFAIPSAERSLKNPITSTPKVLSDARAHFADHCAVCHANDGSGRTPIGQNLYPKAPDMRQDATQSLTDGEIFYVIHNGIRFTGMPAWGPADPKQDGDSWKLVHFIRHLPRITAEELAEMKTMNPTSRHEMDEEEEIERFLRGDDRGQRQEHKPQH